MKIDLKGLTLTSLGSVDPGTFVYPMPPNGGSLSLGVVVEGGQLIRGRVLLALDGDQAFTGRPVRDPSSPCVPCPASSLSCEFGSIATANFYRKGNIVLTHEGTFLVARLCINNFDDQTFCLNLENWTIETSLPGTERIVLLDWRITARDAERGEDVQLTHGPGEGQDG